jgi:outer membrane protein assembly factor BamE
MQFALKKTIKHLTLFAIIGLLAGCQSFKFPGVYKINIQQGNIITQEMIDQLQPGMTKRQVRYIMGNPMVQDTFNPDRWDYIYSMKTAGGDETKERVSIFFENDKLTGFNGDYIPSSVQPAAE